MTTVNNFDLSSTGTQITLDCSYDMALARWWFNDTFHILKYGSCHESSILVYGLHIDHNVKNFDFNDKDNYDVTSMTASELFIKYYEFYYDKSFTLATHTMIKDLEMDLDSYYDILPVRDCEVNDIFSAIVEHVKDDLPDFIERANIPKKFAQIESRGYSQGDHSYIIIPESIIKEFPDQTLDTIGDHLQDEIDHLIWDTPIYCRITVNDVEFDLTENLENMYDYDKDTIIHKSHNQLFSQLDSKDYNNVTKFLEENLPDELIYN